MRVSEIGMSVVVPCRTVVGFDRPRQRDVGQRPRREVDREVVEADEHAGRPGELQLEARDVVARAGDGHRRVEAGRERDRVTALVATGAPPLAL